MKKKVISALLASTMIVSLVACGSTGGDSSDTNSKSSGTTASSTAGGDEAKDISSDSGSGDAAGSGDWVAAADEADDGARQARPHEDSVLQVTKCKRVDPARVCNILFHGSARPQFKEENKMVKIRLKRMGMKKAPFYRIVVIDSRDARDGRPIEEIGYFNPMTQPVELKFDDERAKYWLGVGAQPTQTVKTLLRNAGVTK